MCNYCHKNGHIQRVCRTRIRQQQSDNPQPPPAKPKKGSKKLPTHMIDEEVEPPAGRSTSASPPKPQALPARPLPVDYKLFEVGTQDKVDPYMVPVVIDGATLLMEIDTGSALTLISQTTFSALWPQGKSPHLESTSIRLRTYSGEELRVVGRAVVGVRCGGQVEEELGLVVVGGNGPSLLGRDWLGRLRLDWREIQMLNTTIDMPDTLEAVLARHNSLFSDELGTIRGVMAKLHVSPGAKPRFHRPRSIPYAVRSRVDQAL